MEALVAPLMLLACVASATLNPPPAGKANSLGDPPKHEYSSGAPVETLEPDLQRLFEPMKAPVLADVEGTWFNIGGWSLPDPTTQGSLQMLALFIDRNVTPVNGAWVFQRTGDPNSKAPTQLMLAQWLMNDPSDRSSLINGATSLYKLSSAGQRLVCRSAPELGLGAKMMKGEAVGVFLAYSFSVRYKDPQTGKEQEIVAPEDPPRPPMSIDELAEANRKQAALEAEREKTFADPNRDQTPPIEAVSDGDYDAGEGKLMKLTDLLKEVGKAFHKTYFVDGRFRQNRVFIRGKFTPDRFIAALRTMTTAEPSVSLEGDAASRKQQLESALEQLWNALADADGSGSAAAELKQKLKNGQVGMTARDMFGISRDVEDACRLRGLSPDMAITVHRDLNLVVAASGSFLHTANVIPIGLAPKH